jgi:hypothetical protein
MLRLYGFVEDHGLGEGVHRRKRGRMGPREGLVKFGILGFYFALIFWAAWQNTGILEYPWEEILCDTSGKNASLLVR